VGIYFPELNRDNLKEHLKEWAVKYPIFQLAHNGFVTTSKRLPLVILWHGLVVDPFYGCENNDRVNSLINEFCKKFGTSPQKLHIPKNWRRHDSQKMLLHVWCKLGGSRPINLGDSPLIIRKKAVESCKLEVTNLSLFCVNTDYLYLLLVS